MGIIIIPALQTGKFGVQEVKELPRTTGLIRGKAEIGTHLEGFQAPLSPPDEHLRAHSNAQQIPLTVTTRGSLYNSPHLRHVLRQALGQACSGLCGGKEEGREPPGLPSARGPARRPGVRAASNPISVQQRHEQCAPGTWRRESRK